MLKNFSRLFSCGTGKDGASYLVEWDDSEGYIKRTYNGLKKPCFSTIHFDSTHKGLLAAGDDHMVKFWNMDSDVLWKSTEVDAELLVSSSLGLLLSRCYLEVELVFWQSKFYNLFDWKSYISVGRDSFSSTSTANCTFKF